MPVTALWLILPPVKLLVPVWQLSHEAVVGMWPLPCASGVTPAKAGPVGAAAWQLAQLPGAMPVWFIGVFGPKALVDLWQLSQASVVGK